ncbi:MAG: efflux transporter outer membrane subunit [Deltaproteobacteria bacterium]|jgi:multidrug efflux system outer membrane protein|nr:efflux transporter outer membrane subunit [Deltaproteobacteria bacterium]
MYFSKLYKILTLGLALLTASCTMAPDYERPEAPVPMGFPAYPEYQGVGADPAAEAEKAQPANQTAHLYVQPSEQTEEQPDGQPVEATRSAPEASAASQSRPEQSTSELTGTEPTTARQDTELTKTSGSLTELTKTSGSLEVEFDEVPASGNLTWREFFTDPGLQRVIALALENNRDLRAALLNVEKARAMYQIQRADLLPSIRATGSNSNQLMPADMTIVNEAAISRQSSATVGFTSFELDLFGRVRSLKDSALENYFAITQNAHSAQISLVAETASAYLTLVSYKELYALTDETYQSRKKSYDMTVEMFNQGLASQLVLNQAKVTLEEARVAAVQYRTTMLRYENALALLIGGPLPGDLVIPARLAEVERLKDVPEGLPSYLLERRPDILAAEHQLRSANANIGAARASFFPRISLTGNLGYLSTEMDNLFDNPARTWMFAPSVSLPIFEGGRLFANLRVSEAEKAIAVTNYEKAIQNGFREVADALAFRSTAAEQVAAAASLMDVAGQSYELSNIRYDVGVDSFLNVLDAQRSYFSAQQAFINTILSREINTLNLYKALGGGWE